MGRSPCCPKEGMNRGAWSAQEDKVLIDYIRAHGEGKWRELPKKAGLKRCGKSCRLRWLNYLRPEIKRGKITADEEELILRLHRLLGNRWSLIAGRLPGRTDNEIKNYWNTTLSKKAKLLDHKNKINCDATHRRYSNSKETRVVSNSKTVSRTPGNKVFITKATRCTKVVISPPLSLQAKGHHHHPVENNNDKSVHGSQPSHQNYGEPPMSHAHVQFRTGVNTAAADAELLSCFGFGEDLEVGFDIGGIDLSALLESELPPDMCEYNNGFLTAACCEEPMGFSEEMLQSWRLSDPHH